MSNAVMPAICVGKIPMSRALAKANLDKHQRSTCPRCRAGYHWNRYRCSQPGPKHWHVGHLNRGVSL